MEASDSFRAVASSTVLRSRGRSSPSSSASSFSSNAACVTSCLAVWRSPESSDDTRLCRVVASVRRGSSAAFVSFAAASCSVICVCSSDACSALAASSSSLTRPACDAYDAIAASASSAVRRSSDILRGRRSIASAEEARRDSRYERFSVADRSRSRCSAILFSHRLMEPASAPASPFLFCMYRLTRDMDRSSPSTSPLIDISLVMFDILEPMSTAAAMAPPRASKYSPEVVTAL